MSKQKNAQLRDIVTSVSQKHTYSMKPVTYETHQEEWRIEMKKNRKVKQDDW